VKVAGTHNGVISNFKELLTKSSLKYEVDSQIIWDYLLLKKDVGEIRGWGSCAALVTTPKPYMIFFRFNHEALYFVDLPEGGTAYASTMEALTTAYAKLSSHRQPPFWRTWNLETSSFRNPHFSRRRFLQTSLPTLLQRPLHSPSQSPYSSAVWQRGSQNRNTVH